MLLRFQQEAAALARLDNPGIVKIYDAAADEYGGRIVMELLPGRSLSAAVPPEGLSLGSVKSIALQVAAALSCAHEHGILHRDIKPGNIVVDDAGHATLTDFGIARVTWPPVATATLTVTAAAFGTPIYMSPEQVERSREDVRTDVYSLGVVLYELVTGHPPFEGEDAVSVAIKHLHQVAVLPSVARPGLPGDWDAVITRSLAKAPSERFQSAAALERAIALLLTPDLPPLGAVSPPSSLSASSTPAGEHHATEQTMGGSSGPVSAPRLRTGRRWRAVAVAAPLLVLLAVGTFLGLERRAAPRPSAAPPVVYTASPAGRHNVVPHGAGPGQFDGPSGIGIDPRGFVWVADIGNNRVQELSPAGVPVARFGSRGNRTGQFNTPEDLAVTSHGAIYVDDRNNFRIEKLAASGEQVDELPVVGAVAVDPFDHLYVADLPHERVWEYSWNGDELGRWSVPNVRVQRRPYPAGIAVDRRGYVYVADRANSRVLVLAPRGPALVTSQILGTDPRQYSFNHPSDVSLDRAGNIYVADTRNNRIVRLSPQGKLLSVWGSAGNALGQFNQPSSLAVDARGDVYVTDYFHDRVQKFSPAGKPLWATAGALPIHA
jgi:serine/threonine-protein kinase